MDLRFVCAPLIVTAAGLSNPAIAAEPAESPPDSSSSAIVDFAREIEPIFRTRCYTCHGPDKDEGGLRLHTSAAAQMGGNSGPAYIAGDSGASRLMLYVAGLDESGTVMPPEGERLSSEEIERLRNWIDSGAKWPEQNAGTAAAIDHWSLKPVIRREPPTVSDPQWVRNAIDSFVLAKLDDAGIRPSPEADRATLVRRLYLDLFGLLPEPEEVDAFLADAEGGAYERLVDRLLASPHYGERWGRHWLDLARYADSDGYEKDLPRPFAWRYRNWVIAALNRDLPFDQFTIQQLAGDLLPAAATPFETNEQLVATGFHRNTLTNREGGVDQEEYRVKAVIDRVNTTGTVWLGLTVGCAECHSHKYDPLTQREYYGLFAFFNSAMEKEIAAPLVDEITAYEQAKQLFDVEHAPLVAAVEAYERTQLEIRFHDWRQHVELPPLVWTPLKPVTVTSAKGAKLQIKDDLSILAGGDSPDTDVYTIVAESTQTEIRAIRLEAIHDASLPSGGPGRVAHGNFVLSEISVTVEPIDAPWTSMAVPLVNPTADFAQEGWPVAAAVDGDAKTGWAIAPAFARYHSAVFQVTQPIGSSAGMRITVTLNQQHGQQHTLGRFRLSVTGADPPAATSWPDRIVQLLMKSPDVRDADEQDELLAYYRTIDSELVRLRQIVAEHAAKAPAYPATKAPALAANPDSPPTHIHVRGDFLRKGAAVEPHTPSALPPIAPCGEMPDRLDLAKWLVDPANPLTARVTVNRMWQRLFGRGLVATVDDFGTRGDAPSHADLLDWLASDFVERGWSMKQMLRLIVTSATYRQSSRARPELLERDPRNVLLARQNRLRLEAEIVRDVCLAAGGLLNTAIGGPSVRPPLPAGVADLGYAGSVKWTDSEGADRYRRGLYIFFQRTVPYPMLMTFDAPDTNVCAARRERSNTPLQALVLMNDPVFFECAQGVGRRMATAASNQPTEQVRNAFRICMAREPDAEELAALVDLHRRTAELCEDDRPAIQQLVGSPMPEGVAPEHAAACVVVARAILNLDEFYTRE